MPKMRHTDRLSFFMFEWYHAVEEGRGKTAEQILARIADMVDPATLYSEYEATYGEKPVLNRGRAGRRGVHSTRGTSASVTGGNRASSGSAA